MLSISLLLVDVDVEQIAEIVCALVVGLGLEDLWIYALEPLERVVRVQEWLGFCREQTSFFFFFYRRREETRVDLRL